MRELDEHRSERSEEEAALRKDRDQIDGDRRGMQIVSLRMATLLTASAVLPMEDTDRRRLLQPGAVLVDRNVIAAVGPPETFKEVEAERVDLAGHALIPGLHNCHMHSGLLRGTAEDLPLLDWATDLRRPDAPGAHA